ncbi:uncharacterized protein [Oscarella lobularis]|uniref:uncharacterized protein isoform X2 n=1 Tax=Oscarella lobularis TaxID=121494 RepID=UPI00331349F8
MTREDPCVLPLSRSESLATSSEQSFPGSAGSLNRESKAKKAKKEITRQTCSSFTAGRNRHFREAILREEASQIDAQIFHKLFKEISAGDYAHEDPLVSEESVEEFRAAMSITAPTTKLSKCLSAILPELQVYHQKYIERKSGQANDQIDVAAVLKILLLKKKIDTDPVDSGRVQLHRDYELLWKEDLPLANVQHGSFPCLGLEINHYKAVLHGFVTDGKRVLHSKLAAVTDKTTDAMCLTFLRRLRAGVLALKKEWEKFNYEMPFIDSPQFVPDSFEAYQGLSCGKLLNQLASNAAFRCKISTHKKEKFAIKFVFGHDGKYGGDVHKALASAQLAPRYLFEGTVPFIESRPTTLYVVMEAISWRTLQSWLESSDDALPPGEAIIANLQRVISVLHKNGLVHGDFRPSNILVNANGDVKIVDFNWSAKAPENRLYPKRLNGNIVWPGRPGTFLKEVHDHFFFASIKTRIREAEATVVLVTCSVSNVVDVMSGVLSACSIFFQFVYCFSQFPSIVHHFAEGFSLNCEKLRWKKNQPTID